MFLLLGVTFSMFNKVKGLAALTLQKQDVQQTKELVEQYQAEMALLQQQNELLMKFKEEQMQQLEKKLQDVVNTAADTLKKPSLKNLVASAAGQLLTAELMILIKKYKVCRRRWTKLRKRLRNMLMH